MPRSISDQIHSSIKEATKSLIAFGRGVNRARAELNEIRTGSRKAIAESRMLMAAVDEILKR